MELPERKHFVDVSAYRIDALSPLDNKVRNSLRGSMWMHCTREKISHSPLVRGNILTMLAGLKMTMMLLLQLWERWKRIPFFFSNAFVQQHDSHFYFFSLYDSGSALSPLAAMELSDGASRREKTKWNVRGKKIERQPQMTRERDETTFFSEQTFVAPPRNESVGRRKRSKLDEMLYCVQSFISIYNLWRRQQFGGKYATVGRGSRRVFCCGKEIMSAKNFLVIEKLMRVVNL